MEADGDVGVAGDERVDEGWIKQNPELIVGKISSAVDFIKSKDKKIGLTLHCRRQIGRASCRERV